MVFGEVSKPGKIESDRPMTVLMTVAQAGGVLPTGSLENIRVFYIGNEGVPHVRLVNLKSVSTSFGSNRTWWCRGTVSSMFRRQSWRKPAV